MCADRIILSALSDVLDRMHAARARALLAVLRALLGGERLSLTALGRSVGGPVAQRYCIKRVDRLLGNRHLQAELPMLFGGLARHLIDATVRPVVLVDWTEVGSGREALVAALAIDGRSIPIYAEVHPKRFEGNAKVHRAFLKQLAEHVMPKHFRPIIVTDAGFQNPWFRAVAQLGWDFLGRTSKNVLAQELNTLAYTRFDDSTWLPIARLHARATHTPQDFGANRLARSAPLNVRLVGLRKHARHRKGHSKANRRQVHPGSTSFKKHQRRGREPWILATSLQDPAATVVGIYGERMQIEEAFRDAKSHRFGWSFEDARCRKLVPADLADRDARDREGSKRLEVLLLLAALGMLVAHTLGKAAERADLLHRYQANSTRHRRVLSLFFIGRHILRESHPPRFTKAALQAATNALRSAIEQASRPSAERIAQICGDP